MLRGRTVVGREKTSENVSVRFSRSSAKRGSSSRSPVSSKYREGCSVVVVEPAEHGDSEVQESVQY